MNKQAEIELEDWQMNLIKEADELKHRIDKLDKFIESQNATLIHTQQLDAMNVYYDILCKRIGQFVVENNE